MPAEEGGIPLGSDAAKASVVHATLEDVVGQGFFRGSQLLPGFQAAHELHPLFDQLLLPRLQGKVALGKGDGLLPRVTVLGDEVAGVAGEHKVFDLALSALAVGDQFRDATKMVFRVVTSCFAGLYGALNGGLEVLPAGGLVVNRKSFGVDASG